MRVCRVGRERGGYGEKSPKERKDREKLFWACDRGSGRRSRRHQSGHARCRAHKMMRGYRVIRCVPLGAGVGAAKPWATGSLACVAPPLPPRAGKGEAFSRRGGGRGALLAVLLYSPPIWQFWWAPWGKNANRNMPSSLVPRLLGDQSSFFFFHFPLFLLLLFPLFAYTPSLLLIASSSSSLSSIPDHSLTFAHPYSLALIHRSDHHEYSLRNQQHDLLPPVARIVKMSSTTGISSPSAATQASMSHLSSFNPTPALKRVLPSTAIEQQQNPPYIDVRYHQLLQALPSRFLLTHN